MICLKEELEHLSHHQASVMKLRTVRYTKLAHDTKL